MDGVTLLAAGLTGAVLGVTVFAVIRHNSRARVRRPEAGPRTVPGPRAAPGRPGPAPARTAPVPPPPARPRPPGAPVGAGFRPPVEALGGETMQLGPVPAWKLPVRSGSGGAAPGSVAAPRKAPAAAAAPAAPVPVPPAPGAPAGLGRGEYASTAAQTRSPDEDTVADVPRAVDVGRDGRLNEARLNREARGGTAARREGASPSTNASRRHDPRSAPGRGTAAR